MLTYRFELLHSDIPEFEEKDHVILAQSLTDAIQKFARKHDVTPPAYWDEPSYEREIEIMFKNKYGTITYQITW